jgi:hypothetical protein
MNSEHQFAPASQNPDEEYARELYSRANELQKIREDQEHRDSVVRDRITELDQNYIELALLAIAKKSGQTNAKYCKEIVYTGDRVMGAFRTDGQVELNTDNIDISAEYRGLPSKLVLLKTLIHEQTHAATNASCIDSQVIDGVVSFPLKLQTGYNHSFVYEGLEAEKYYTLFNEGVTEKLARQMTIDYLEHHPDFVSQQDRDKFIEMVSEGTVGTYDVMVAFVEAMVSKIAESSGISEKVAWEGLLQGQFSGHNFQDKEIADLMDEMFGKYFNIRLGRLSSRLEAKNLIKYGDSDFPKYAKEKFIKVYTKWQEENPDRT